jgi:uncharacterized surface protein with fasciclin (FAS1) repeats
VNSTNTKLVELTNAYIVCNNGVIHFIDEVMVPFTRAKPAVPGGQ